MGILHPIETMDHIRATYLRYLKTIYPIQDQRLRTPFWQALEKEDRLVKGPLLESAPPFVSGRSIAQLVEEGVLHPSFQRLCSAVLPYERPLYNHQDQAISHLIEQDRNVIVATGTGSGKTEAFLIPILNYLLREQEAGTLSRSGVRALLLYPMNALANDQLKRLRCVLVDYPAISFGRYTGETEEKDEGAINRFFEQFPHETRLPNELLSRRQMRVTPPHILLTNYAMLEYLLLRPEDCEFFDGPSGKHWRFLVLDEAHIYDGASGIELAILLRRLKDRVVGSQLGRLRCIATSATLGRGREDFLAAATFASNLFGESFEWKNSDPLHQDVVEATRLPTAALGEAWGEGTTELYQGLRQTLLELPQDVTDCTAIVRLWSQIAEPFVPSTTIALAKQRAHEQWLVNQGNESLRGGLWSAAEAFLYTILAGDRRLHTLHTYLGQEPYALNDIASVIFPQLENAANALVTLVELAVRARPTPTSFSLLPARYHAFVRALEGAFACFNESAHADRQPRVFLNRHEICPECHGWVVELATCIRCGATYAVGGRNPGENTSQGLRYVKPLVEHSYGKLKLPSYFLLGSSITDNDEDEAIVAGDTLSIESEQAHIVKMCLKCGRLLAEEQVCTCQCPTITFYEMKLEEQEEPRKCLGCGAHSTGPIIFRFLTGQDAPVSVLATALYQQIPPDPEISDLPGEGRKLLIFSDSRQDAAFFAPYLEQTYQKVLHRRLILRAVDNVEVGQQGQLRLQDLVRRLLKGAEEAGIFTQRQSFDQRQTIVTTWLMQELISLDRRLSLEGIGLLQFRLVRPQHWRSPSALQQSPWDLTEDEAWILLALLLDTLRQQGVTRFPDRVDPKDVSFSPRNKVFFVRKEQSESGNAILSWLPTRGINRRLDLLERLLTQLMPDASASELRRMATESLSGLWTHLTEPGSCWRDHLVSENRGKQGIAYRLSYEFWELVPCQGRAIYRCSRCRAITALCLRGLCPTLHCDGRLEPCQPVTIEQEENHYRVLYQTMQPYPLVAEEHTAQWTSNEAGKVQERFIHGEVNALSCSTTFELGVDVGELQVVLMRNVPPTTANYIQRAGRAGRRTDSAAFALTYAQRRSHDLTHYKDPVRIVAGRVHPPRIMLANEKIVRRHMQAVLLAAFLRATYDQDHCIFSNVGDFFQSEDLQPSGTALLATFIEQKPEMVREALRRIVPEDIQAAVGVEDWSWLRNSDGDGMHDLLERVDAEVTEDLTLYAQFEREASSITNYPLAQHYKHVISTIRSRSLLGFLASRNLLPKYGFPTDVVELKTDHLERAEASKVQLERDLRIAIAEYAPGAEVVAAKLIWTGGGLYKQPKKTGQSINTRFALNVHALCGIEKLFGRSANVDIH